MEINNNEITILAGETFTIDRILENKDGSPYIVSDNFANPHWLICITNSVYHNINKTLKKYWLPLSIPLFNSTVPVALTDLKNSASSDTPMYTKFSDVTEFPITCYYNSEKVDFYENDCVFYVEDEEGNREYKYWEDGWKPYECRLVKLFTRDDTIDLTAQNYYYSVSLVGGQDIDSYIRNLALNYNVALGDFTTEQLYDILRNDVGVKFPPYFDINQPIGLIDVTYPILETTKFKVKNNISMGGSTWEIPETL